MPSLPSRQTTACGFLTRQRCFSLNGWSPCPLGHQELPVVGMPGLGTQKWSWPSNRGCGGRVDCEPARSAPGPVPSWGMLLRREAPMRTGASDKPWLLTTMCQRMFKDVTPVWPPQGSSWPHITWGMEPHRGSAPDAMEDAETSLLQGADISHGPNRGHGAPARMGRFYRSSAPSSEWWELVEEQKAGNLLHPTLVPTPITWESEGLSTSVGHSKILSGLSDPQA